MKTPPQPAQTTPSVQRQTKPAPRAAGHGSAIDHSGSPMILKTRAAAQPSRPLLAARLKCPGVLSPSASMASTSSLRKGSPVPSPNSYCTLIGRLPSGCGLAVAVLTIGRQLWMFSSFRVPPAAPPSALKIDSRVYVRRLRFGWVACFRSAPSGCGLAVAVLIDGAALRAGRFRPWWSSGPLNRLGTEGGQRGWVDDQNRASRPPFVYH